MKVDRDFAGRQFLGSREAQEDSYAFSIVAEAGGEVRKLLIVLADGVGGAVAGRQASQLAVKAFIDEFFLHDSSEHSSDIRYLHESLIFANETIAKAIRDDPALEGMGTTLLAATISARDLQWISVGDSPLLLYREGKLTRLNADHSMRPEIARQIQEGKLPPEMLTTHPERNALRSALNGGEIPEIDLPGKRFALAASDLLLFASDGIQTLNGEELQALLASTGGMTALQIVRTLLASVQSRNARKQDNTTVAAVAP